MNVQRIIALSRTTSIVIVVLNISGLALSLCVDLYSWLWILGMGLVVLSWPIMVWNIALDKQKSVAELRERFRLLVEGEGLDS